MDLNDLLVSYKQVRTPTKPIPAIPIIEQQPISQETPTVKTEEPSNQVTNNPTTEYYISSVQAPGFKAKWNSPYKDKNKWATDLANSYKRAGITNDNAIRMLLAQDALESGWGRSAQGKFNFGNLTTGSRWKGNYVAGNDKNAKGEAIKQKFRSYNSMDEYAADKVQFLKRLYDFDENDDINKFAAKLTGSNKGKRRYAEARNYANTLKKVYNSYRSGGIIKYQEGLKINWNPEPKPSGVDIIGLTKKYAPSIALSFISRSVSPFINKLIEGKPNSSPNIDKVVDNIWNFENSQNKGFKNGLYYPYRTGNGNVDIGPGFDLEHQTESFKSRANKGMSKQELNDEVKYRLNAELPFINERLNKVSNNNADTISPNMKEGLLDMYWQLDNGVYKYDDLFEAIAKGDINSIREESKVKYKSKNKKDYGTWKYDSGRYQRRVDNYFHY